MTSRLNKSSKLLDTKLPLEERLESITFFVDRTLGRDTVPTALSAAGLNVEVHADHFQGEAPDIEWLNLCGQNGWVALSHDKGIKKNPLEREAVIHAGIAAFFLTRGDRTGKEDAGIIIKATKRIANLLASQPQPFIARILLDGKVEMWVDHNNTDLIAAREARRLAKKRTRQV
jgi:hypothetical protein